MAGLCAPLSTLRQYPHGYLRMTRGRCGSLLLHRDGLAPSTPCRSPGALRSTPRNGHRRTWPGWFRFAPEPEACEDASPVSLVLTRDYRSATINFATARTLWRKTSATGLNVRFFNVKIATGLVLTPKSIGRRFTVGCFALRTGSIQAGTTVR